MWTHLGSCEKVYNTTAGAMIMVMLAQYHEIGVGVFVMTYTEYILMILYKLYCTFHMHIFAPLLI